MLLPFPLVLAQNLIPNPGFEAFFTDPEFQWIQPEGVFYHYETGDTTGLHSTHSGQFINGLCMYNTVPNEYLHIKLLQPLKAGRTYRLSFYVRLMRAKSSNAYEQKMISAYFGDEPVDTRNPGDLFYDPQVHLVLPDSGRYEWFRLTADFQAAGSEQYFTLGYFPDTQKKEARDQARVAYMQEVERRYNASRQKTDADMSWLYMSPEEQKKFIKAEKRKRRKNKDQSPDPFAPPPPAWMYENEDAIFSKEIPGVFASRYYFDDFCLVEVFPDGHTGHCNPENRVETPETGKTIALQNVFFQSDSDTLLKESDFQLNALLRMLETYPAMKIEIRGYTDNTGTPAYNLDLSRRRAASVKEWLLQRAVNSDRVSIKGFGQADPVAPNTTEAGRARNRRVTFFITSM